MDVGDVVLSCYALLGLLFSVVWVKSRVNFVLPSARRAHMDEADASTSSVLIAPRPLLVLLLQLTAVMCERAKGLRVFCS